MSSSVRELSPGRKRNTGEAPPGGTQDTGAKHGRQLPETANPNTNEQHAETTQQAEGDSNEQAPVVHMTKATTTITHPESEKKSCAKCGHSPTTHCCGRCRNEF